jgi:hypothetical protein
MSTKEGIELVRLAHEIHEKLHRYITTLDTDDLHTLSNVLFDATFEAGKKLGQCLEATRDDHLQQKAVGS